MSTRLRAVLLVGLGALASVRPAPAQCPDGTPAPCDRPAAVRAPSPGSLAVLYFDNLSRDSADEYLADGFTEQLIVRLGRVERLEVRLRSEVRRYRHRPLGDPAVLAGALNVRFLLAGSVRKVGPRVIVTVELSQPRGRAHRVWGDVFDRSSTDVLDVETSIAEAVASAVAGRLAPEERAEVRRLPTRDAAAYDLFQQANAYMRRHENVSGDEADARSAVAFYRAAVQRDSAFVAAWAGLAEAWYWLTQYAPTRPALLESRRAAARALALDSSAAEARALDASALAALAYDWSTAEAEMRRAARTAPRSALPWSLLASLLDAEGRFDEALAAADSAMVRDSVSSFSHWAVVVTLVDSRRWRQLAGWEPRIRPADPLVASYARSYSALGAGRPLDALRTVRELPYTDVNVEVEALVAADSLEAARAFVARARSAAEERLRDTGWYDDPDGLAAAYAMLGEKDEAFLWLERAYAWGNADLLLRLKVIALFDNLRADPRYHSLLRRMHLEP